jgi:hypothetical protein
MTQQRPQLLVSCCLAISTLCAVGVIAVQNWLPQDGVVARRDEFQSLVGGLGFGATVNLSECAFSFDPRLRPNCSHIEGPIPAGFFLCPKHVGRVIGYPHLLPAQNMAAEESDHATIR